MADGAQHKEQELANGWTLLELTTDEPFIAEGSQECLLYLEELVVGLSGNARDVWSQDLLFYLLELKTDFLTVRRVKHQTLH